MYQYMFHMFPITLTDFWHPQVIIRDFKTRWV